MMSIDNKLGGQHSNIPFTTKIIYNNKFKTKRNIQSFYLYFYLILLKTLNQTKVLKIGIKNMIYCFT